MKISYNQTAGFEKELRKLSKRYRTLSDDLKNAEENAIELYHLHGIDNNSCFELQGCENNSCRIYKLTKFACKSMKGKGVKSGIRVIYAFCKKKSQVCLIEIYYKQEQENEDRKKIKDFLEHCKDCYARS